MRKALRLTASLIVVPAIGIGIAALWLRLELNASLPAYDGERALADLTAPVTVERDAVGVATIRSDGEFDEARALGFVHAQERFFQMDLLRRSAAGELAALVGHAALDTDRAHRIHGLGETAVQVVENLPADVRGRLEAYVAGINSGLAALDTAPFEYLLLRQTPRPWRPEDSILVMGAMYFDLQDENAEVKRQEIVARRVLPEQFADFLYPDTTAWDTPLVGEPGDSASIPGADIYDLRKLSSGLRAATAVTADGDFELARPLPGSNNWAIGPDRAVDARPLLANDPHLALSVPSIWFRVSLVREGRRVTGASLPGLPVIVIGSNGELAWGLTNSYGDWTVMTALEPDPLDDTRYLTPDGSVEYETVTSTIEVAGSADVEISWQRSLFGPVVGTLPDERPYAVRWVGQSPRGYNFEFSGLHEAAGLTSALRLAQSAGMPAQNIVIADRSGDIGWTIAGPIPDRIRSPLLNSSVEGPSWNGWLEPDDYPTVVNPPDGLLWTANGRVVEGGMLTDIGNVNYDLGARGRQIRDRLLALDAATIADMLAIQLDDEALFLSPWRDELLELLADESDPVLVAVRDAVRDWGNRAAVDSVGYRLVRGWRLLMIERMAAALTVEVRELDADWTYRNLRDEHWAWPLVDEEPIHLLDPRYADWRSFKLDTLNEYVRQRLGVETAGSLATATWGDFNRIAVRHPLSQAVPVLSRWLDMPARALPGDSAMPRVQSRNFGASARFAVSPGDEANGYFHMPGGQSGHPLSPYYGAGHDDWAEGRASPFLPGPVEHTLRLVPGPD